jgi:hypothetical protein
MLAADFIDFSRIHSRIPCSFVISVARALRPECSKFSGSILKKDIDIFYDPRA